MSHENQGDLLKFCAQHKLVLLADEVYQDNVYHPEKEWTSFRKVGPPVVRSSWHTLFVQAPLQRVPLKQPA